MIFLQRNGSTAKQFFLVVLFRMSSVWLVLIWFFRTNQFTLLRDQKITNHGTRWSLLEIFGVKKHFLSTVYLPVKGHLSPLTVFVYSFQKWAELDRAKFVNGPFALNHIDISHWILLVTRSVLRRFSLPPMGINNKSELLSFLWG